MIGNCYINKQPWVTHKGPLSPVTLIFRLDVEIGPTTLVYQQLVEM